MCSFSNRKPKGGGASDTKKTEDQQVAEDATSV